MRLRNLLGVSSLGRVDTSAYLSLDWPEGTFDRDDIHLLKEMDERKEPAQAPNNAVEPTQGTQQSQAESKVVDLAASTAMAHAATSVDGGSPTSTGPQRIGQDSDSDDATSDTAELLPHALGSTAPTKNAVQEIFGQIAHAVTKPDIDVSALIPRCVSDNTKDETSEHSAPGIINVFKGGEVLGGADEDRSRGCLSRCVRSGHCFLCTLCVLLVLGSIGVATYFFIKPFIHTQLKDNLVLKSSMEKWANPDEKPVFSMFMYNITNPEEVFQGKPMNLEQMGPYVYRLKVQRTDVSWNDNGTVSYREKTIFEFAPELTQGSLDDIVTTVNLPLAGLLATAGRLVTKMMSVDSSNIFVTRTVNELLWGYENDVLKKIGSIGSWDFLHLIPDVHDVSPEFGILKDQNDTSGPLYNVYTGEGDFSKFNKVYSWDYKTKMDFWATKEANAIRGSDGSMFKPFLTSKDNLTVFEGQLSRTFDLQYQKRVAHGGIIARRYIIPDTEFSSSVLRGKPDDSSAYVDLSYEDDGINAGPEEEEEDIDDDFFDSSSEDSDSRDTTPPSDDFFDSSSEADELTGGYCSPKCLLPGVYSLAKASKGVPMIVSLPHFLGADPAYSEHINGLQPDESLHRPIYDVDEVTGITVYNRRRHQINIRLDDPRFAAKYVPLFWNDIAVELTDNTMSDVALATTVMNGVDLGRKCVLGFSAVCALIVAIAPAVYCLRRRRTSVQLNTSFQSGKGYVLV